MQKGVQHAPFIYIYIYIEPLTNSFLEAEGFYQHTWLISFLTKVDPAIISVDWWTFLCAEKHFRLDK